MLPSVADQQTACEWMSYWGFERNPFGEHDSPYVSLPSHDEAVARVLNSLGPASAGPR